MAYQEEAALKLLEQFPNHGSLTLGRIAFQQQPTLFLSIESARSVFRRLRGMNGIRNRNKKSKHREHIGPPRSTDAFGTLPEGKTCFEAWGAVQLAGPLKALVLSDVHFPYHNRAALLACLEHGQKRGVDTILLNGDIADCFAVSFWEKDPRERKLAEEIKVVREFLIALRAIFKKARIVYKDGNHEERWERYLRVKAPELLGIAEFELPAVLKFSDAGIDDYVSEKRPIRLGDLNVIHGHEYKFAISSPVNPARGLYLRAKTYAMCGHFHQISSHTEKSLEQKNIATWSVGCLCELHPEHAVLNNWSHGFAIVEVDKSGKFEVQNKYIANGKVY